MSNKTEIKAEGESGGGKKKGLLIVIIAAVVVLLAGGGGAAWFFMSKGGGDHAAEAEKPKPKTPPRDGAFLYIGSKNASGWDVTWMSA